jgi:hypothetical protein
MKKMKLWNLLLIVVSAAVLPFSLVAIGQAQQMTCWCIKPSQTGTKRPDDDYVQASSSRVGYSEGIAQSARHSVENEEATARMQAG